MKHRTAKIIICLSILFSSTACAIERTNYFTNRAVDLIEVAHLDGHGLSFGLMLNTGPVMLGGFEISKFHRGTGHRAMFGIGGLKINAESYAFAGILLPFVSGDHTSTRGWYKKYRPRFLSVGFDLAFIYGIGAHADVAEAFDFVLGIFTIDILGDDYYPRTFKVIKEELNSEYDWVRREAAENIKYLKEDKALILIKKALKDKDLEIRRVAASVLEKFGGDKALPLIEKLLQDKDDSIRWSAAKALGKIESKKALVIIKKTLKNKDSNIKETAVYALGRVGGENALALVIILLKDKDYKVRAAALYTLKKLSGEKYFDLIKNALGDEDYRVRVATIQVLGMMGREDTFVLIAKFAQDKKSEVREATIYALGNIGGEKSFALIEKALEDKNTDVQRLAARLLIEENKKNGFRNLLRVLKNMTDERSKKDTLQYLKWNFQNDSAIQKSLKEIAEAVLLEKSKKKSK